MQAGHQGGHHTPPHPDVDEEAKLEREALGKVALAFRRYQADANLEVDRWEQQLRRLPPYQQALLAPTQLVKFQTARQCIYNNQFFIRSMLSAFDMDSGAPSMLSGANAAADDVAQLAPLAGDTEKVRYVLKNLVRDWSVEGVAEREASYGRIIRELQIRFKDWDANSEDRPRVLFPGAGLARLCCEAAGAGFDAQGNEFAYFMLITSSFVLNSISERDQYTVFPWVTATCNVREDSDQLRGVSIPDVCPLEIVSRCPIPGLLSMAAGDFVEIYSKPDQRHAWDAVTTCFFIDTAHNVVQYLEVLAHCIKPGGYWINLGPLLYHWAEGYGTAELSIELSLAEIKRIAGVLGFTLLREEEVLAPYIGNIRSMYQTEYRATFWTMQKTSDPGPLLYPGLHVPGMHQLNQTDAGAGAGKTAAMGPGTAPAPVTGTTTATGTVTGTDTDVCTAAGIGIGIGTDT